MLINESLAIQQEILASQNEKQLDIIKTIRLFSKPDLEEMKLTEFFSVKQILLDNKAKQIFSEGNIFKKLEGEFLNLNTLKEFERKR